MEQLDPARDLPALSGACYRGDARAIVTLLAGRDSRPLLQHAGIGLVVALGAGLEHARELLVGSREAWRDMDDFARTVDG